jgi:N-acetylglucosamine kinase-like BadF-type ATPase
MTRFVLGIDGGGTGTRAAIMTDEGRVCGLGSSGPSNYSDVGVDNTRDNLREAVTEARRACDLPAEPFAAVFLGLGGVASHTDREIIRGLAQDLELAPRDRVGVDHDIRIALAGGLSGRPGIVLIAGTGSSCYGRNSAGESWRSGGWGPLVADEGSGYWLGIEGIKAAVRAFDGRGPSTMLLPQVQARLALPAMDDLLHLLYVRGVSRKEIAALAPLVTQAAAAGDVAAIGIVERGCAELADCVLAVAERLGLVKGGCELALTGGLFRAGEIITQPLREAVTSRIPGCRVALSECPPVIGACLLALEVIGTSLDGDVLETLQQSAHLV